jgi:hypothetical protein
LAAKASAGSATVSCAIAIDPTRLKATRIGNLNERAIIIDLIMG